MKIRWIIIAGVMITGWSSVVAEDGQHLKTSYSSFMNGEHTKDSIYHFDKKM